MDEGGKEFALMHMPAITANEPFTDAEIRDSFCISEFWQGRFLEHDEALFVASLNVIGHFLGTEWINKHIFAESGKPEFMRPTTDPRPRFMAAQLDPMRGGIRVIGLAESLLNLQSVEGFSDRLKRLESTSIESTIAELMTARLLFMKGVHFRFLDEVGAVGRVPDIEATLFGRKAVCETKCKTEGTLLSSNTIRESLREARDQMKRLTDDGAGLVFMQIPELWIRDSALNSQMSAAVSNVLRNTKRISCIVFFWEFWSHRQDGTPIWTLLYRSVPNPGATFPIPNFELVRPFVQPPQWRSMHNIVSKLRESWSLTGCYLPYV
jgi:hypothetical protein